MQSSAPVTALGFDFVDPDGDQTLFEVTVCATTFDANDTYANGTGRQCPVLDTIEVFASQRLTISGISSASQPPSRSGNCPLEI